MIRSYTLVWLLLSVLFMSCQKDYDWEREDESRALTERLPEGNSRLAALKQIFLDGYKEVDRSRFASYDLKDREIAL